MRPHAKTHKSPLVARWQIDRGAIGICCAKLGEAEVFADAGFTDIRLPYPINPDQRPARPRAARPHRRSRSSSITSTVARGVVGRDDRRRAHAWTCWSRWMSASTAAASIPIRDGAFRSSQAVASLPGLRLRGLLSHAGHAYHAASEDELRAIAEDEARTLRTLGRGARAGRRRHRRS